MILSLPRRTFLAATATALTAATLVRATETTDTDVIVIGAGAAGLAAASALLAKGRRVTVLEARDRVGGRAVTDVTALGIPFDRGAQWLHNAEVNPFLADAERLGRQTWPSPLEDALVLRAGRVVADGPLQLTQAEGSLGNRAWRKGLFGGDFDLGSVAATEMETAVAQLVAFAMATDANRLSARDYGALEDGADHSVEGGLGRLIADVWAAVPVQTGRTVQQIDWSRADRIAVSGDFGSLTAAQVVITVPAPVLAAEGLRFNPPLPVEKLAAIAALKGGHYVKVGLRLDAPLADLPEYAFDIAELQMGRAAGLHIDHRKPLVTAIFAGSYAEAVSRGGHAALKAAAMETATALLGNDIISRVQAATTTDWSADPLALGPYTTVAPGDAWARAAYGAALDDRLFFAGDSAGGAYAVTVMGARRSGEAAAERILSL